MIKTEVRIAELKAHLSHYLRSAQKGTEVVIKDRDTPIAILVPHQRAQEAFATVAPTKTLAEVEKYLQSRPRFPAIKPATVKKAFREARMDAGDRWLTAQSTSTRR